jgi:hypothetical protein
MSNLVRESKPIKKNIERFYNRECINFCNKR